MRKATARGAVPSSSAAAPTSSRSGSSRSSSTSWSGASSRAWPSTGRGSSTISRSPSPAGPRRTSADRLRDGRFGAARETGEFLNRAIREGVADGLGLGALGRPDDRRLPLPAQGAEPARGRAPAGHPGHGPRRRSARTSSTSIRAPTAPRSAKARSGISSRFASLVGGARGRRLRQRRLGRPPSRGLPQGRLLRPEQGRPARTDDDGGLRFQPPLPAGGERRPPAGRGDRGGDSISSAPTRS